MFPGNKWNISQKGQVSRNPALAAAVHRESIGAVKSLRLSSIRVTEQMNSENWKEIELNYCGTQVKGIYKISARLMTVVYGSRTKTAKLGILPADMLAHMLLRELEFERRETKRNTLGE